MTSPGDRDRPVPWDTPPGGADADLVAPGLVHELRQPLTAVEGAAALLERSLGAVLLGAPDWRLLRQQLARLGEILGGFEELLRAGTGPRAFPVDPVLGRAVELLGHRIRALDGRFLWVPAGRGAVGWGEPAALVHAATNLIANAIDAVEERAAGPAGPTGRVAVRVLAPAAAGAGGVAVRVSDEGVGVTEAARARLFEARFTTKPQGKGTGLGLHLARRLVGRQGGKVYLVPADDGQRLPWAVTEFCIELASPPEQPGGAP